MNTPDRDLLTTFLAGGPPAHDAFRTLTTRYVGLIYATARRQAPPHLAEDITQAVFLLLAQKAKAKTLRNPELLPAWLLTTTRFCAAAARRQESRRHRREQEVAAMTPTQSPTPADLDPADLTPHLDTALLSLSTPDRTAILLRYYNNNSIAQIAVALNLSEEAAKKRVSRALEKLRKLFAKKRLTLAAPLVATLLARNATALPADLITKCATPHPGSSAAKTIAQGARLMMTRLTLQKTAVALLVLTTATVATLASLSHTPAAHPLSTFPVAAPASPPASAPSSQPSPELLQRATHARDIAQAINIYAANRRQWLPADLGVTLRSARGSTLRDKAAVFISPADPANPQIPDSPDGDWINNNTSFVYLGNENVPLKNLPSDLVIIHEKFSICGNGPITLGFIDGHAETFLHVDVAKKVIDTSKQTLDAAAIFTP